MKPNILLVIMDSVRAKNCSIYGHENKTTPFFEDISDSSYVFDHAHAPGTESMPSHASIFSGYHVEEHKATEYNATIPVEESIWHELGDKWSYKTGLFSSNEIITQSSNLHEPFDKVVGSKRDKYGRIFENGASPTEVGVAADPIGFIKDSLNHKYPIQSLINGLSYKMYIDFISPYEYTITRNENASVYTNSFLKWTENIDKPWAACINLMDAHWPYAPEPEHNHWAGKEIRDIHHKINTLSSDFFEGRPWGHLRAIESLYDGCINQMDTALKNLVASLKKRGEFDDTLIIITSDHGQGFGERSRILPEIRLIAHNWGIGESITNVPLIVKEPMQKTGEHVSEPASLTYFPEVVTETVREGEGGLNFVANDTPVICSNYNLPPDQFLPDGKSVDYGPWRALYMEDEGVIKYAQWGKNSVTTRVVDPQTEYKIADVDGGIIEEKFDKYIDKIDFEREGDKIDDNVKRRLEELGYKS